MNARRAGRLGRRPRWPVFRKRSFAEDQPARPEHRAGRHQKLLQKPACSTTIPKPFPETIGGIAAPSAAPELPGPEPGELTGIKIGYARVSTGGQNLERQLDALKAAGCRRVFAGKQSGRDAGRPELVMCLAFMAAGDTLVVPSLDRLSRSLHDLITIVGGLRRQGVGFTSLHETLDTTTPGGRLVFHVFAALAEFSVISTRRAAGIPDVRAAA